MVSGGMWTRLWLDLMTRDEKLMVLWIILTAAVFFFGLYLDSRLGQP